MQKVTSWEARRSGGAMTITGRDEDGHVVRIAGVVAIEAGQPWPIATDRGGAEYELICDGAAARSASAAAGVGHQAAA